MSQAKHKLHRRKKKSTTVNHKPHLLALRAYLLQMEEARIQSMDVGAAEELRGPVLLMPFSVMPLDQHSFIFLILFVICCWVLELSFCNSLVGPVV